MKLSLSLFVCLLGGAAHSFALNCGDTVSGNVTLNADLTCNGTSGLTVGAHNTTINLNGHTIKCVGNGVAGSCQIPDGANMLWTRGIFSQNFSNVKILGPGTITGFAVDVALWKGGGFVVDNVSVAGPMIPLWENIRGTGVGVQVSQSPCPIVAFGQTPAPTAIISNNEVSGLSVGISLESTQCAQVKGNIVHHVNAGPGGAFGIALYRSGFNQVYRNSITNVGVNRANDAGLYMWQIESHNNDVFSNVIMNNCGHGMWVVNSTHNNNFTGNTVKYNGDPATAYPSCDTPQKQYFDLYEFSNGAGNTWNMNNVCRKQNGVQIPNGVCNPNE